MNKQNNIQVGNNNSNNQVNTKSNKEEQFKDWIIKAVISISTAVIKWLITGSKLG